MSKAFHTPLFPLRAAFLALPLEEKSKWEFQAIQESLRDYENILRFQNPQTPHLTLQYWPELMEIEYRQIVEQARKIAADRAPFTIRTTEATTFGSRGRDHVLFLEIAFSDELARVKKACPWPNVQPFHPHITLARIRHPEKFAVQKKKIFKLLDDVSFDIPVDRLRLYGEVNGMKQTLLEDFLFPNQGR